MKKSILLFLLFAQITFVSAQSVAITFDNITKVNNVLTFRVRLAATGTVYLGDFDLNIDYLNTNTVVSATRSGSGSSTSTDASTVTLRPGIASNGKAINFQGTAADNTTDFEALVPKIENATITLGTFAITFSGTPSGILSCSGSSVFGFSPATFNLASIPSTCSGSTRLPLDLLAFTATTNSKTEQPSTVLSWSTAQEVNTAGFDVERGADGKIFEKVGHVKSLGTSNGTYDFTDVLPLSGVNYYRLKMLNTDGSFTYSPVRSVTFGKTQTSTFAVVPNPAKERVSVQLNAAAAKTVTVMLVDITGKVLFTQVKQMEAGFNEFPLSVAQYPQGLYFLKVVDAKTTETHRLVIAN